MTETAYRRMARYAGFAVVHLLVVVLAVAGVFGEAAGLVVLVFAIPLVFAWGPFQADVALNEGLSDAARSRWRISLWLLPWSMAAYWLAHVRQRREGA